MATAGDLNIGQWIWGSYEYAVQTDQTGFVDTVAASLRSQGIDPATASQAQVLAIFFDKAAQSTAEQLGSSADVVTQLEAQKNAWAAAAGLQTTTIKTTSSPPAGGSIAFPTGTRTTAAPARLQPRYTGGDDAGQYCEFFPDDPYCNFWGDLGGLFGGIGGGGGSVSQTIVYQTGLLAEDVHSIVDDALNGLWSAEVVTLDLVLGGIVAGIQNALTSIGNALKAAWNILSRLGGLMLNFLKLLWNKVVTGLLRALHDLAAVLKDLYTKVLRPMLVNLQQLRAKLLDIYKRFIRPVLIILQDVRKVLAVLVAFHVPFAKKLDATLANLERRISAPLLLLLRYTNAVANWVNLIITAGYLLQRSIFLNSLKAYVGSVLNLQINAMTKPISSADRAILQTNSKLLSVPESTAAADEYMKFGTGPNAAIADQATAALQQYLTNGF